MYTSPIMGAFESANERQFEELLRDGVTAVKCGQISLAESLLNRASILNPMEARPYVWLSATTEDPEEQREFLEQAVACDPSNAAARRGLALLSGKFDRQRLIPETGESYSTNLPEEIEAKSRSLKCPQCGGLVASQVGSTCSPVPAVDTPPTCVQIWIFAPRYATAWSKGWILCCRPSAGTAGRRGGSI